MKNSSIKKRSVKRSAVKRRSVKRSAVKRRSVKRSAAVKTRQVKEIKIKTVYYDGVLQNKGWAKITPYQLYISRDTSRAYWMLEKVKPKISFNSSKLTITVGKNKLVCKSSTEFENAKRLLK